MVVVNWPICDTLTLIIRIVFMMNRIILTAYLLLIGLYSNAQNNFEGIVTYKINLEIKENAGSTAFYYEQKYGDTLKVYYATNGDQLMEYVNSGELGLDWAMYLVEANEYYSKWRSMDSIFYNSCDTNYLEVLSFEKLDKINISDRVCEQYLVECMATKDSDVEFLSRYWYFNDELPFDGELYSDYKDARIDSVYSLSNSHPIGWKSNLKHVIVDVKLLEIQNVKLDSNIFQVPEGIKLVRY